MSKRKHLLPVTGFALFLIGAPARGQTIPEAPSVPVCSWDGSGARSTCKFKDVLTGTPTSVAGHRVIVFRKSNSGGLPDSRTFLDSAVKRLEKRYGFATTITEDPEIFTPANLADTKAVIMSNGDGDVIPKGPNRTALEEFQTVQGWGVIWIHHACAFITSGWPFGQQSCVQQYFHHNPSGTQRRIFLDSGTADAPDQGIKSPQTEFLLRNLPGWNGSRSLSMGEQFLCFQAPARNTEGVNVLLGYDHSSGLPPFGCPNQSDASEAASQAHNLAWTHMMGKGISIVNSLGHDDVVYTAAGNMGDSLLWRFIRYAAKDWCVDGSGEPGCGAPTAIHATVPVPAVFPLTGKGLTLSLPEGRYAVSIRDMRGRLLRAESAGGTRKMEIAGLPRGLCLIGIRGEGRSWTQRVMVY